MYNIIIKRACQSVVALALFVSGELYAQTNLALNKNTTASSALQPTNAAVDGNSSTRWESTQGIENSWIQVDLGGNYSLTSTAIDWEAANPATYQILGSLDGNNWTLITTRTGGVFGNRTDTVALTGIYHFLRINATQRSAGNSWGYSIWEWRVFGGSASSSSMSSSSSLGSSSSSIAAQSLVVQAEDYSAYFDSTTGNTGGAYHPNDNVDIEAATDTGGGYDVGWITAGEWLEYKITLAAGTYNVSARVASATSNGAYSLQLDGTAIGAATVNNTNGWQAWTTQAVSKVTVNTSGVHTLRFNATGADFNINWLKFDPVIISSSSSVSSQAASSSSIASSSSSSSLSSSSKPSSSSSSSSLSSSSLSNSSSAVSALIQAEDYSAYMDLTTGNTGGAYRPNDNVDIEATSDVGGGFNVGWITQGEWLEYKVTLAAGTYNLNARVASGASAGQYTILIDSVAAGSATVGNTGGWQSWITQTLATKTFTTSTTHTIRVQADASDFNLNWIQFEVSGSGSSSSSSSSTSSDRNHYDAPRAVTAPIIDGVMDSVWDAAPWAPIDVFWLGTQRPTAQDFSGRYKAMWDAGNLYLLFDITDDVLFDSHADPLDHYWDDDSVEIFIDENKNGGNHQYNTSAWAYHVSSLGDVVDFTNSTTPQLLNNHITMRRVSVGTKHMWEMSMRVYGENYDDAKTNIPVLLYAGKQMGFSVCYNDNDGSAQRESMVGSVDTQGHKDNMGYIDASVFGSMSLVESLPK